MFLKYIKVDPQHADDPLLLPGVEAGIKPFAGLEEIAGADDESPAIRKLAGSVRQSQALSSSAIAIAQPTFLAVEDLAPHCRTRFQDERFLIMPATLDAIFSGWVPALEQGNLPSLGGMSADVATRLERQRLTEGSHAERFNANLGSIIPVERGGYLLEIGAGVNTDRLLALNALALSAGARLICHDVVGVPAKLAAQVFEDRKASIPYIVLPAEGNLLRPVVSELPQHQLTVSLMNVISTLSASSIAHLAESLGPAGHIIVTQSLASAHETNFVPAAIEPPAPLYQEYIASYGQRRAAQNGIRLDAISPDSLNVFFHQAEHTFHCALLQGQLDFFSESLASFGYSHRRTAVTETSVRQLDGAAAEGHLATHFPELSDRFKSKRFNSIWFNPFGGEPRFDFDSRIKSGSLELRATQLHVCFNSGKNDWAPKATSLDTKVSAPLPGELLCPVSFALLPREHFALSAGIHPSRLEEREFKMMRKLGALSAVDLIVDGFGREIRTFGFATVARKRTQLERQFIGQL